MCRSVLWIAGLNREYQRKWKVKIQHVNVSRCGRFFCCDDWQKDCKIVMGSVKTGRTAVVCESKMSRSRPQNTHAHAYLTPDLKWIIFNSDRNGFPHVHAASVSDDMVQGISRPWCGCRGRWTEEDWYPAPSLFFSVEKRAFSHWHRVGFVWNGAYWILYVDDVAIAFTQIFNNPKNNYGYKPLVDEIVRFFKTGDISVSAEETIEIYAFMSAADISKAQDGEAISLEELIAKTRRKNEERRAQKTRRK